MARPLQKDRKRRREEEEKSGTEDGPGHRSRVLPVAELPEGFEGEHEDGAMYLLVQ